MSEPHDRGRERYSSFPQGFFDRFDSSPDRWFYASPRIVTHIDRGAIEAVGKLYEQLGIGGTVLDLMGSWVSHFNHRPERLIVHGLNGEELRRNADAHSAVVVDLNAYPELPFTARSMDAVVCAVSIDYLTRPLEVLDELARIMKPGKPAVVTFSNRCFPTKAIRGWLASDDAQRCAIVASYFSLSWGWTSPTAVQLPTEEIDPVFAVWARRSDQADSVVESTRPPNREV